MDNRPKLAGLKAEVVRVDETNAVAQQIREIGAVTSDFGAILENMRAQIPRSRLLRRSSFLQHTTPQPDNRHCHQVAQAHQQRLKS